MAFQGVYIRLPEEVVGLLDALSPHVGSVHPARQGRTSVLLWLIEGDGPEQFISDPDVKAAWDRYRSMIQA